jgi:hypothetical protein
MRKENLISREGPVQQEFSEFDGKEIPELATVVGEIQRSAPLQLRSQFGRD